MTLLLAFVAAAACSAGQKSVGGSVVPAAVPQTRSGNVLVNPGAEIGDSTLTGYDSVTIPGWDQRGLPTVVAYGVDGFPTKQTRGAGGGNQFFTGGPFGSSTLTQTVDVSAAANAIDGGGVTLTISGRLGGEATIRDDAQLLAVCLNAAGKVLGQTAIGPVTSAQRSGRTAFLKRSATADVPRRTRAIRVTLSFTMYQAFVGGQSLDDGFADDLSLVLSTPLPAPPTPAPPVPSVPAFDHVFFVYFENRGYSQIVGATRVAPAINELAQRYSLLGHYYALHHPSDANYVLQSAGGTFGLHYNAFATTTISTTHLADLVENAGGDWKQYMESANGACDMKQHGYYYPDDGPYMYYADVRNDAARCKAHVVPWEAYARDLRSAATTPKYAWLSPDDCDDGEGCGISASDRFLKNEILKPLLASPAWNQHKTLLVVAWDEDDFTAVNHIAGIFVSPYVKHGYRSRGLYTHYSILRTLEAALGVSTLTNNDRYAAPIDDVWKQ